MATNCTVEKTDNYLIATWASLADNEDGVPVDVSRYVTGTVSWSGNGTSVAVTGKNATAHAAWGAIGSGVAPAEDVITTIPILPRLIRPEVTGGTATSVVMIFRK